MKSIKPSKVLHHSDGDYVPLKDFKKLRADYEALKAELEWFKNQHAGRAIADAKKYKSVLEKYAEQTLYTCDDDGIWIKPGKIGYDDPPTYSEFPNYADEALEDSQAEDSQEKK